MVSVKVLCQPCGQSLAWGFWQAIVYSLEQYYFSCQHFLHRVLRILIPVDIFMYFKGLYSNTIFNIFKICGRNMMIVKVVLFYVNSIQLPTRKPRPIVRCFIASTVIWICRKLSRLSTLELLYNPTKETELRTVVNRQVKTHFQNQELSVSFSPILYCSSQGT